MKGLPWVFFFSSPALRAGAVGVFQAVIEAFGRALLLLLVIKTPTIM
jgi:hypothetical protein